MAEEDDNHLSCGLKWGTHRRGKEHVLFLTGEYFHAIDAKFRLTIPAKLRESINRPEEGSGFFAVQGYDTVLYLYTPATYQKIAPQFDSKLQAKPEVRKYLRLTHGLAENVEVDKLGRVLIPENMLRRCGLTRDVAIVGVQDHIEVWDRARWESFVTEQLAQHDALAEQAIELAKTAGGSGGATPAGGTQAGGTA
jgi:MraZ protein